MQKVDSRKITLIVLFILILGAFALLISKFTFAYLGPDIDEEQNVQGEVTTAGDTLIFSKGNDLSLSPSVDNFGSSSGNLTATTNPSVRLIANTKSGSATAKYYSGILINENTYTYSKSDNTAELILTVRDETGAIITSTPGLNYVTVNGVSGFDITGKTGAFNIVSDKEISTTSTTTGVTQTWTYTITFINFGTEQDQSINENAKLDAVVALTQKEVSYASTCERGTFACEIANKYTTQGENNLYYHNLNLVNGAGDYSYRYAGSYETTDNWVCFGTDAATCDDEHLYRIIGVFDNKVKLIKAYEGTETSLGSVPEGNGRKDETNYKGKLDQTPGYKWNTNFGYEWMSSTLNKNILNASYLKKFDSIWLDKIALSEWKVKGNERRLIIENHPAGVYLWEIMVSNIILKSKIGLMYISDYGFASSPANWSSKMINYASVTNTNNNWLFLGVLEWTLTQVGGSNGVAAIGTSGNVFVLNSIAVVRPAFYLNSNVKLTGGSGTETDPYRIV